MFTTFTASNPSIYLDIDRAKALALGVNISDIFTALQATLGGVYVNNFNLYGRTWQVNVQAEASDRSDFSDIWRIYVRNSASQMVPIRSIAGIKIVTGPQVITRYNNYRSITVNGAPRAGRFIGGDFQGDAAGGLQFRMDWDRLSGAAGLRSDRIHPLAGGAVRLSVPGGSV